jgi:hypothetical protein
MQRSQDLDSRTEIAVIADNDLADVKDHAIEVEVHSFPKFDVRTKIAEEWWLEPHGVTALTENLLEQLSPQFPIRLASCIQCVTEVMSHFTLLHQFRIQRIVQFSSEHFLAFGSHFQSSELFVVSGRFDAYQVWRSSFSFAEGYWDDLALRPYSATPCLKSFPVHDSPCEG